MNLKGLQKVPCCGDGVALDEERILGESDHYVGGCSCPIVPDRQTRCVWGDPLHLLRLSLWYLKVDLFGSGHCRSVDRWLGRDHGHAQLLASDPSDPGAAAA